jgi:hypothetical protein
MRLLKNCFERPLWIFWGTHLGEANGPRQWANRKLFDPPEAGAAGGEFLRFSEQVHRWVKKSIGTSEKEFFKGLVILI